MIGWLRAKYHAKWNDCIGERVNRQANRAVVRASKLWHTGNRFKRLWAMWLHARNIKRYGCEIYPQAILGQGLYIPHCVGIVVGNTAIIGENCVILPNAVIGARYSPKKKNPTGRRHAKIGDNCVIGTNSTIIGDITIGNNVIVGAGALVTKDVPDDTIVVGVNQHRPNTDSISFFQHHG